MATRRDQILKMFHSTRVLRARDFVRAGMAREYLSRLVNDGILVRPERGLYVLSDDAPTEHRTLVEATRLVPAGVICLLSALQFHGLTTQSPFEVWMAIDHKARPPKSESLALRIVRFTGLALTSEIEEHILEALPFVSTQPQKQLPTASNFATRWALMWPLKHCVIACGRRKQIATNSGMQQRSVG